MWMLISGFRAAAVSGWGMRVPFKINEFCKGYGGMNAGGLGVISPALPTLSV